MYLSTVCGVVLLHRALISHTFPNNLVGFILEIPVGDKVERKAEFQQKQNISVFSVKSNKNFPDCFIICTKFKAAIHFVHDGSRLLLNLINLHKHR